MQLPHYSPQKHSDKLYESHLNPFPIFDLANSSLENCKGINMDFAPPVMPQQATAAAVSGTVMQR